MAKLVKDYSKTDVSHVDGDTTLKEIIDRMVEEDENLVWVEDEDQLSGVIGEEEIFNALTSSHD